MNRFFDRIKVVLLLLVVLCLAGCTKKAPAETATEPQPVSTTLMIYMIGSDLEAKSGSATADLEEITQSGVDLSLHNVIVFAGGSPRWHNEAMAEQQAAILRLTESGFEQISTMEAASMGTAESLTAFLDQAVEACPADRYGLILWDHGNGPVMGYGQDLLFDGDALLLEEMKQAMEASCFGPDNKLSWVGFDACLMSSAELAVLWTDYADFLVASQEVEPSFGWDYSFLEQLGEPDVQALLCRVTEDYLATCEAYYAEKGYENRDTTLACLDLSKTQALSDAINNLFKPASMDVAEHYNLLAVQRVRSRALGRASTGSEYDLIDLHDLAECMKESYPQEAAQLQAVLDELVVANATNAQRCCGLSIYYPFFNKYYYENSWQEIYTRLGLFPEYQAYLEGYRQIWQGSDKLEQFAQSVMPQEESAGVYVLPLTTQQTQSFASARYYIIEKAGVDLYTKVYSSSDVSNVDGLLVANFDGNVLYAKNDLGEFMIPVVTEHDTVDELTRYSMHIRATNYLRGISGIPNDEEHVVKDFRYYLTQNNESREVAISALLPYTHTADLSAFSGSKQEETLDGMRTYIFLEEADRFLTRYENGAIMPFDSWPHTGWSKGKEWAISNGLHFSFEPLAGGEYYLIFEIQDTQGNSYCSELLPIQVPYVETEQQLQTTTVEWSSGERVLLKEADGVALYLKKHVSWGEETYILEAENSNGNSVVLYAMDLLCNGNIADGSIATIEEIPANKTGGPFFGVSFGVAPDVGDMDIVESLNFEIQLWSGYDGKMVWPAQRFDVRLSGEAAIKPTGSHGNLQILGACRDGLANEQVLFDQNGIRVTLLGAGVVENYEGLMHVFKMENLSDQTWNFGSGGVAVNDVFFTNMIWPTVLKPHTVKYTWCYLEPEELDQANIRSVETIRVQLGIQQPNNGFYGVDKLDWYDVQMASSGKKSTFPEGKQVLFEENGVRITLKGIRKVDNMTYWDIAIYNGSEYDICIEAVDVGVNGQQGVGRDYMNLSIEAKVGAGQYVLEEFTFYGELTTDVVLKLRIMNFIEESILFTGTKTVTLKKPA